MSENEIGVEAARGKLGDLVDSAALDGTVTYLTRRGRRYAAITPLHLVKESTVPSITFTARQREIIDASGRTVVSDQIGATSGRLLEPEYKPAPGDIRPCPVSRELRALVLRSGIMGPFKRGDGSGMEPGLHYWFEYVMVEPIAGETDD
jgi:hypothetical protein